MLSLHIKNLLRRKKTSLDIRKSPSVAKFIVWPVIWGLGVNLVENVFDYLLSSPRAALDWPTLLHLLRGNLWLSFAVAFASFMFLTLKLLYAWRAEFVTAHYKGLYRLVSNRTVSDNLEQLESTVTAATNKKSLLRSVALEYVISSMEAMGNNGFAIADSEVDAYVGFITELARQSEHVAMTCVVRPYWFVVDEIQGVALPPYINARDEFGKGEHLQCFKKGWMQKNCRHQRCLIIDELMVAEVLLSAVIDVTGRNMSSKDCPVCQSENSISDCPFHGKRKIFSNKEKENLVDVPEIWWFSTHVNKGRGVNLIYTLVSSAWRASCSELDDRVFASSDGFNVDLRFSFTGLERGTMRLYWGDAAKPLAPIARFNVKINPESGIDAAQNGHKFYENFSSCLTSPAITAKINEHLDALAEVVTANFTPNNVASIASTDALTLKKYLCSGNHSMQEFLHGCIQTLIADVSKCGAATVYQNLVNYYVETSSAPVVAYVVTLDPVLPQQPVRIAQCKKNWEGILNAG